MDEFITFAADYNFLRIMVTFTIALLLLLVGYWIYVGRVLDIWTLYKLLVCS